MTPAARRCSGPIVQGGGFTDAERAWLPLGDVTTTNVAAQRRDGDSVLTLCRDVIAFRRRHPEFSAGTPTSLAVPAGAWAWTARGAPCRGPQHVTGGASAGRDGRHDPALHRPVARAAGRRRRPATGGLRGRGPRASPVGSARYPYDDRRAGTPWNVSSARSPSSPAGAAASEGRRHARWPARAPRSWWSTSTQAAAERVSGEIAGLRRQGGGLPGRPLRRGPGGRHHRGRHDALRPPGRAAQQRRADRLGLLDPRHRGDRPGARRVGAHHGGEPAQPDAHLQARGARDGARRRRFDHQHVVGRVAQGRPDPHGLRGLEGGGERPHDVRGHEPREAGHPGQHDPARAHHHRRRTRPSGREDCWPVSARPR